MFYGWPPYVQIAERRRRAALLAAKLRKTGRVLSPVVVEKRTIARTFWGQAWCRNLERYSDYANRLPRGRTYVRNGSVFDLQIAPGRVTALVSGSSIYEVVIRVAPLGARRWRAICKECSGEIGSLVELLQGRLSRAVMERICRSGAGLFPAVGEISLICNCPDWASMCKHIAAVLYGIGARVDERPELFFTLRAVDQKELIARAGRGGPSVRKTPAARRILADASQLSDIFGLEMAPAPLSDRGNATGGRRQRGPATRGR